jgi:hypothetical protein
MRIIPLNRIVKNIDEGPRSGHGLLSAPAQCIHVENHLVIITVIVLTMHLVAPHPQLRLQQLDTNFLCGVCISTYNIFFKNKQCCTLSV